MIQHQGEWMFVCGATSMHSIVSTPDGEVVEGVALKLTGHVAGPDDAHPAKEQHTIYLALTEETRMLLANGLALIPVSRGEEWENILHTTPN